MWNLYVSKAMVTKKKMIIIAYYYAHKLKTTFDLPRMDTSDLWVSSGLCSPGFRLSWNSGLYDIELWLDVLYGEYACLHYDVYDRNPDDTCGGRCVETYRYDLNGYDLLRFGLVGWNDER